MSDTKMLGVEKLNESIDELENQLSNIKSISEMYKQLEIVKDEICSDKEMHVKSVTEIVGLKGNMEKELGSYEEYLEEIRKINDKLLSSYNSFGNDFINHMQSLSSENNRLYLEFQQILNSKLDRTKSDLELSIRELGNGVNKAIDEKVTNALETQSKRINLAIIFGAVSSAVSLIAVIIMIIK